MQSSCSGKVSSTKKYKGYRAKDAARGNSGCKGLGGGGATTQHLYVKELSQGEVPLIVVSEEFRDQ